MYDGTHSLNAAPLLGISGRFWRATLLTVCAVSLAGCSRESDVAQTDPTTAADASATTADPSASLLSDRAQQMAANATQRSAAADGQPSPAADPPSILAETAATLQLPPDASPQDLLQTLADADQQMRQVANGETDLQTPEQVQSELKRLARLKLTAAERLASEASLPPELLKQSKRGKLQALSHLVSLGEASSGPTLKAYAKELSESTDPTLAVESRLVLIGFAMEELQASDNPQAVVDLVTELSNNAEVLDLPALMTMGQARAGLQQYGYAAAARDVRDQIVSAFQNHPDPNVRAMADDLASAERFDVLDSLRRDLEQDRTVTPSQWEQAATNLVRRGADMGALRYLTRAALDFEVTGMDEFTAATYRVLEAGFQSPEDPAVRNEQQVVLTTYAARQNIIGQPLQVDLPDTLGSPLRWESYRGKVVLMPFWAAEQPESIAIFRQLEAIRDKHSGKVALVGVNVDFEETSLAQFEQQVRLDWPSLRSPDPMKQGIENPLAMQTGVTSFPFVVLIDQQGIVRKLFLTNVGIEAAVEKWVGDQP